MTLVSASAFNSNSDGGRIQLNIGSNIFVTCCLADCNISKLITLDQALNNSRRYFIPDNIPGNLGSALVIEIWIPKIGLKIIFG